MRLLYFSLLTIIFCSCSSTNANDKKLAVKEENSAQSQTKPQYSPKEIMDNLAWQWRDHHHDMYRSLLLTYDAGFKMIYDHQSHNPSIQGMYGDYVRDNGLNSFFELVVSSAYPDHPSNLTETKNGFDWMKSNCSDLYLKAKQSFILQDYVLGMRRIFQCQDHNPSWEETCRATFRDNRNQLIALLLNP